MINDQFQHIVPVVREFFQPSVLAAGFLFDLQVTVTTAWRAGYSLTAQYNRTGS